MTTREIVRNYIYNMSKGEIIALEDYVRTIFKGQDKVKLRKYCKEQEIYYKKGSTREMLMQCIYGMCKTALSYKIFQTTDVIGESVRAYYTRIYEREYKGV